MRGIVGERVGILLALGISRRGVATSSPGQNGFLSAALLGGTLRHARSDILLFAGVLLGLLTLQAAPRPAVSARVGGKRPLARVHATASAVALAAWRYRHGAPSAREPGTAFFANDRPTPPHVPFCRDGWADLGNVANSRSALCARSAVREPLAWSGASRSRALALAVALCACGAAAADYELKAAALGAGAAAGNALSLHLRPRGAGGAAGLPVAARFARGFLGERGFRPGGWPASCC